MKRRLAATEKSEAAGIAGVTRWAPPPESAVTQSSQEDNEERLFDAYSRYFVAVLADTPALKDVAYALRYQVYCVEHRFENPDEHPDGKEKDAYDEHSVQSLLIYRASNTVAGTVRLILPTAHDHIGSLSIAKACDESLLWDPQQMPRSSTAEVSRFAVSKDFRRRLGERGSPSGVTSLSLRNAAGPPNPLSDKRLAPHITLGLIGTLVKMSADHGVTHWCSVMERALLRLLARIGIHFVNIGPEVEYHGRRQPCYADLDELLARVRRERPDVWEVITDKGRFWPQRG